MAQEDSDRMGPCPARRGCIESLPPSGERRSELMSIPCGFGESNRLSTRDALLRLPAFGLDCIPPRGALARAGRLQLKSLNTSLTHTHLDQNALMSKRQPDLLAADAYRRWSSLAATAEKSLTVFSPYLDPLVRTLIGRSGLAPDSVIVVTDLSPASGAGDYPAQLHALRHLIEDGVEVRSLQRLHAKVLLVDDSRATVGSQNFTRYARSSKETTALPDRDLAGSVFLDTLIEWREQALPVDAGLIQMLLDGLSVESKAVKVASAALSNAFDATYEEWLKIRRARELADAVERARQAAERRQTDEQARALWFGELTRKSPVRLAGTYVIAQRKTIPSGLFHSYESLVAERDGDLLRWRRGPQDQPSVQELDHLFMYPILLTETGRMGYGRVGHARITYVFDSLSRPTLLMLGAFRAQLAVTFPKFGLAQSNVKFQFRLEGLSALQCTVSALFDGANLTPVKVAPSGALHPSHPFIDAVTSYCSPEGGQKALAQETLRHFRYERLDREMHNAEDFFEGYVYRFNLIEFAGKPVFLAQKLY